MSDTTFPVPPAPLPPEAQAPAPALDFSSPLPDAEPRPRLWPGVLIVALLWLVMTLPSWVEMEQEYQMMSMFYGPMIGAVAFVAWWLLASRLRWADKGIGLLVGVLGGVAAYLLCDPSFRAMGPMLLIIYGVPRVITAWIAWLIITPFLRWPTRRVGLLSVLLLTWGYFALVRFEGVDGSMSGAFPFRWAKTAEEKFMAELPASKPGSEGAMPGELLKLQPGDWPGFRGPQRDGRLTGVRIATDWKQNSPRKLWSHRIGPGWSSFAVVGNRLYTQLQRGEDEMVVCYNTDSGELLWTHRDSARFTEAIGGPGPRATPTFHDSRIYALGAAGRLNCLDAATGTGVWSKDIVADSGANVPQWGFASSPLVVQGVVTVFAGGPDGKSVLGYRASTGELAWTAGDGQNSYSSLHGARLDGVEQLLLATDAGLTSFDPSNGKVLWKHDWRVEGLARIVQPNQVGNADFLLGTGFENGTRRLRVSRSGDQWMAQEVWTTKALKPYYNDLVVHGGHCYGFDGMFFTCVNLDNGKGKWKARGYGNGQVLLLADQDLLLVLTEKGEVALVEANPNQHKELARFQAIEGKTWNHPVVAHGKLFVRNGEEVACFQLSEKGD